MTYFLYHICRKIFSCKIFTILHQHKKFRQNSTKNESMQANYLLTLLTYSALSAECQHEKHHLTIFFLLLESGNCSCRPNTFCGILCSSSIQHNLGWPRIWFHLWGVTYLFLGQNRWEKSHQIFRLQETNNVRLVFFPRGFP